jgi:hypothetical protein
MYLDKVFVHAVQVILYSVQMGRVPESWIFLADSSTDQTDGSIRPICFSAIVLLRNLSV